MEWKVIGIDQERNIGKNKFHKVGSERVNTELEVLVRFRMVDHLRAGLRSCSLA